MTQVPIAIVGCGGMGRRHLTGVAALYRSHFRNVDLVAVCDLNRQNANDLADEAAQQLGARPRVGTYAFPFPETDAKILALEYHEFATCIQTGQAPEVTGEVARRDVALVYAALESGALGRPVTLAEVERGEVDANQREIDAHLGLD